MQRVPPPRGAIGAEHGARSGRSNRARVQRIALVSGLDQRIALVSGLDQRIAPAASSHHIPPTTLGDCAAAAGCRPGPERVGRLRR